jgi:hypothetical protein
VWRGLRGLVTPSHYFVPLSHHHTHHGMESTVVSQQQLFCCGSDSPFCSCCSDSPSAVSTNSVGWPVTAMKPPS